MATSVILLHDWVCVSQRLMCRSFMQGIVLVPESKPPLSTQRCWLDYHRLQQRARARMRVRRAPLRRGPAKSHGGGAARPRSCRLPCSGGPSCRSSARSPTSRWVQLLLMTRDLSALAAIVCHCADSRKHPTTAPHPDLP